MAVADTRAAILDATLAVAATEGIGGLTLELVANEADVSRQTVYRYFGNKRALVSAVILREEEDFISAVLDAVDGNTELRPKMERAIATVLRLARDHPLLDRLLESDPEALLPFLTTSTGPVLSALQPVLRQLLSEDLPHLDEAQLEVAADAHARLLVSYGINPPDVPVDELASYLADLIVNGVKG